MGSSRSIRSGFWSREEDELLRKCVEEYGEGNWHLVPLRTGLLRCRKSCRQRWLNYLSPQIKRGRISEDEEDLIIKMHKLLGNKWSLIAGRMPGRTANDIKNYWNSHLAKRLETEKEKKKDAPLSHVIYKPQARRVSISTSESLRKMHAHSKVNTSSLPSFFNPSNQQSEAITHGASLDEAWCSSILKDLDMEDYTANAMGVLDPDFKIKDLDLWKAS